MTLRVVLRMVSLLVQRMAFLPFFYLLTMAATAQGLPPEVEAALARAKVPRDAVAVMLVDAQGKGAARLNHRGTVPMNPASVMKLVTTYAALDLLGPAYTWRTPVYLDGSVHDGTLKGNLLIQGQGDPKLVLERLWLLLRRVQGLGIHRIDGDIVLDRSAWDVPTADPASFDGEPLKPYNAAPDALLVNFKSVVLTFTPEAGGKLARVQLDPPLAGVQVPTIVPLLTTDCGDYRGGLRADFSDPNRIRLSGGYPSSCGEKVWPVAYADPPSFAQRAVAGMWASMGGQLSGTVRTGPLSNAAWAMGPAFEARSAPLAEIIRDINKYSNNVMAQQVFLTLGQSLSATDAAGATSTPSASSATPITPAPPTTFAAARSVVLRWWNDRFDGVAPPVLDNGSGLSRQERISAQALVRLLQSAYASPLMPELMASLPITGVDGTLRRMQSSAQGAAHLKTGSLSDVVAVAGYVHGRNGNHAVLVAIINHPNAKAARPAIDALVEWASR